ncbi:hypothetical protein G5I_01176 [Acromyrmex echinatior]|uniref:Uncharacterized protein n=1 Tax=Acromyrmex echinatior TaxID=103372 RepID=F4W6X0_ACREC|nr:hypothetical protein G5I_01176 [Acromyrmex echinatior]
MGNEVEMERKYWKEEDKKICRFYGGAHMRSIEPILGSIYEKDVKHGKKKKITSDRTILVRASFLQTRLTRRLLLLRKKSLCWGGSGATPAVNLPVTGVQFKLTQMNRWIWINICEQHRTYIYSLQNRQQTEVIPMTPDSMDEVPNCTYLPGAGHVEQEKQLPESSISSSSLRISSELHHSPATQGSLRWNTFHLSHDSKITNEESPAQRIKRASRRLMPPPLLKPCVPWPSLNPVACDTPALAVSQVAARPETRRHSDRTSLTLTNNLPLFLRVRPYRLSLHSLPSSDARKSKRWKGKEKGMKRKENHGVGCRDRKEKEKQEEIKLIKRNFRLKLYRFGIESEKSPISQKKDEEEAYAWLSLARILEWINVSSQEADGLLVTNDRKGMIQSRVFARCMLRIVTFSSTKKARSTFHGHGQRTRRIVISCPPSEIQKGIAMTTIDDNAVVGEDAPAIIEIKCSQLRRPVGTQRGGLMYPYPLCIHE